MAQFLSHAHIECIINGHQVTGWADEDPPYSFPVESSKEFQVGADGALYGISKPMFGGAFHFMVQPSSPTAQWAMVQEQIRKDVQLAFLPERIYIMTWVDPVQGRSYLCEGGVIDTFPATSVAGLTYEGILMFERITADVDGGVFHPPLASNAAG